MKLHPEVVVAIREQCKSGVRQATLAREFGITREAVRQIVTGRIHRKTGGPVSLDAWKTERRKAAWGDAARIRALRHAVPQRTLAKEYGVSTALIHEIQRGTPFSLPAFFEYRIRPYLENEGEGCWRWKGHCVPNGYGVLSCDGEREYVHRASFAVHYGPIPAGMDVLHRCDTPSCANPEHLFLGNQRDNNLDRDRKGRGVVGVMKTT